jgi:hypothetical protein
VVIGIQPGMSIPKQIRKFDQRIKEAKNVEWADTAGVALALKEHRKAQQ